MWFIRSVLYFTAGYLSLYIPSLHLYDITRPAALSFTHVPCSISKMSAKFRKSAYYQFPSMWTSFPRGVLYCTVILCTYIIRYQTQFPCWASLMFQQDVFLLTLLAPIIRNDPFIWHFPLPIWHCSIHFIIFENHPTQPTPHGSSHCWWCVVIHVLTPPINFFTHPILLHSKQVDVFIVATSHANLCCHLLT